MYIPMSWRNRELTEEEWARAEQDPRLGSLAPLVEVLAADLAALEPAVAAEDAAAHERYEQYREDPEALVKEQAAAHERYEQYLRERKAAIKAFAANPTEEGEAEIDRLYDEQKARATGRDARPAHTEQARLLELYETALLLLGKRLGWPER